MEDIFIHKSVWPEIAYHTVSIIIFLCFFYLKFKFSYKTKNLFFIFHTLLVIFIASLQFGLFAHGTEFSHSLLHINLDVDSYDSIYWGALFYSLVYLAFAPRNYCVKYI